MIISKHYFSVCAGTILLVLLSALSSVMQAQVAGATVSGAVTDISGSAIPNATVSIINAATNETRVFSTNETGFFSVPNLQPGQYTIKAAAQGFQGSATHIILAVGAQQ